MAIERALGPGSPLDEEIAQGLGTDLMVPNEAEAESAEVTFAEDGSAEIVLDPSSSEEDEKKDIPFDANLADHLEQSELDSLGKKLVELVEMDDRSRDDWKRAYIKGLDLLGFKTEDRTDPWSGACGVFHPVMTEAVVRFQSQAIMEIFPATGPVKTRIIGKMTREKEDQALRVQQELNYFVMDKMTEFRPETEQLLFYLALAGSGFRKVYFCEEMQRPVARFVPAEDFIVPYGTSDLATAPRYTEVKRMFPNELRKLQVSGLYAAVDIPEPTVRQEDVKEAYNKLDGRSRIPEVDTRYNLLEVHTVWDLPGFEEAIELPYVITVDRDSQKVLAIYRNWEEGDAAQQKRCHYTAYHYLPGLGFYGSGLIHLIGGITSSATSILRQLVDAGTLSNLPGGLKSRGMRIKGDDSPIMPGEFRDVDVPSGNIRDNIAFIPYKEPSATLHALLGNMIEEGRRLGAAPELPFNAMTQQAPVGTTLALLERSMKIMSAVQARLHASLKLDFKKIADIIAKDMGPDYEYEVEDPEASRVTDFDAVDIIPVSDPNASSMAQRVVQYQAVIEMAKQDPGAFDMPYLYQDAVRVLGIQNADKIVKDPEDVKPMDPVSENMAILTGKPVKAFLYQDQEAHIQAHMAAAQDPKILQMVGQSPQAPMIQGAMAAHIGEHLAFAYRKGIEEQMGVALPPPDEPLPEDVEVQLSRTVAEASKRLLKKDQNEAAQQQAQAAAQDPVLMLQKEELELKKQQLRVTEEKNKLDARLKAIALAQKESSEIRKLQSGERVAGAALGVEIAQSHQDNDDLKRERMLDSGMELMRLELEGKRLKIQEQQAKDQARAAMKQASQKPKAASSK
jgi:hypothetical protein